MYKKREKEYSVININKIKEISILSKIQCKIYT